MKAKAKIIEALTGVPSHRGSYVTDVARKAGVSIATVRRIVLDDIRTFKHWSTSAERIGGCAFSISDRISLREAA